MAKPEIIVNAGTAGAMTSVSASSAWTATLDSVDGVRQVAWSVISTDETTTAESYTLVQSGSVGQNVASTSQGQGTAILLKAIVNAGINAATGQADPTNTSATVKIVVPLSDGGIVGCAGEEYESDATFGAAGIINSGIRKAAALSPSGVAVKIVRAATAAALPTNTRTGNVLTATSNAAIGTVGGVVLAAGDYFLVQNEGGGASHVNNGAFYLSQQGDGSNPWKATRATYFDDSAELIAMTTFRIQEGTYAGKERYLVTSGATINVTALEFGSYAYAPVDPAYLMVGASGDLANERDISAMGTTLDFASTTTIPLQASRTDAATAALVDVETVSALSSGSAAAGFGPAIKFLGEVSGGGAENYGRVGFAATDLTGGSEDTKAVLQARTAGAALATVAEFSGTAVSLPGIATGVAGILAIDTVGGITRTAGGGASTSAKYLTDASATVNANDIPIRALSGTLGFARAAEKLASFTVTEAAGTNYEAIGIGHVVSASGAGTAGDGISIAARLVDATPSVRRVGRLRWEWTSPVALLPRADAVLSVLSTDGEHDWLRLTDAGALRLPAYSTAARRPIFAGTDGTITATAIQSSEVTTALGYTPVTNARTLTGTSPITVAGDNSAHDLSADRTIAFVPTANVAWAGYGITGIASLDNSGGAQTIGANTTSMAIGKSTTTATFAGGVTINGSGAADILTVQKDGIGTTKTIGGWVKNATNSGTQVTPQFPIYSAVNGGTTVNAGWQWEPSSTSGGALVLYVGTGATAPATKHFALTSQNSTWGSGVEAYGFYVISGGLGGSGLRAFGNNTGGYTWDGSDDALLIKSYNTKSVKIQTGADSGGTGGIDRLLITSTGATTWTFNAATITRTQWGTVGVNYRDLTPKVLTTTDATATNAVTLSMADNSAGWWEVEAYCYIVGDAGKHAYFHWRGYFNRNGGAPVRDYHAAQTADQVIGAWGTPPTIAIVAGAPTTNDVSVQVTGLAATSIKWTVIARYHVTTTSA